MCNVTQEVLWGPVEPPGCSARLREGKTCKGIPAGLKPRHYPPTETEAKRTALEAISTRPEPEAGGVDTEDFASDSISKETGHKMGTIPVLTNLNFS
jgi:hypothetical protein